MLFLILINIIIHFNAGSKEKSVAFAKTFSASASISDSNDSANPIRRSDDLQTKLGPPSVPVAVSSRIRRPKSFRVEILSRNEFSQIDQEQKQDRVQRRRLWSVNCSATDFEQTIFIACTLESEKFRPSFEEKQIDGRNYGKSRGSRFPLWMLTNFEKEKLFRSKKWKDN